MRNTGVLLSNIRRMRPCGGLRPPAQAADATSALKAEARRRVASGEYFGHIACMSLMARKPL